MNPPLNILDVTSLPPFNSNVACVRGLLEGSVSATPMIECGPTEMFMNFSRKSRSSCFGPSGAPLKAHP